MFIISFLIIFNLDIVVGNRILLSNIEEITFYKNSLTTGYRKNPIPQIINLDGTNIIPSKVTCKNLGGFGNDVRWECSALLEDNYYFTYQNINCEGYDYREDPYKLDGSCSFEYRLGKNYIFTDGLGDIFYKDNYDPKSKIYSGIGDILTFSLILILFPSLGIFFMILNCISGVLCSPTSYYSSDTEYGGSNVSRGYNRFGGIGNIGNHSRWGINRDNSNYRDYSRFRGSHLKMKKGIATSYGR